MCIRDMTFCRFFLNARFVPTIDSLTAIYIKTMHANNSSFSNSETCFTSLSNLSGFCLFSFLLDHSDGKESFPSPSFEMAKVQSKAITAVFALGGDGLKFTSAHPEKWSRIALRRLLKPVAPYGPAIMDFISFRTYCLDAESLYLGRTVLGNILQIALMIVSAGTLLSGSLYSGCTITFNSDKS